LLKCHVSLKFDIVPLCNSPKAIVSFIFNIYVDYFLAGHDHYQEGYHFASSGNYLDCIKSLSSFTPSYFEVFFAVTPQIFFCTYIKGLKNEVHAKKLHLNSLLQCIYLTKHGLELTSINHGLQMVQLKCDCLFFTSTHV